MSSVEKLETMLLMKFSRMMTALIAFQSVAFSPNSRQIDSRATFTNAGGLPIERTSTKCCFFIDFTAVLRNGVQSSHQHEARARVQKREKQKRLLAVCDACGWRYCTIRFGCLRSVVLPNSSKSRHTGHEFLK